MKDDNHDDGDSELFLKLNAGREQGEEDFLSCQHTLYEALDLMHEASMSKDPLVACQGRLSKVLTNALDTWLTDERARQTEGAIVMTAGASGSQSVFFTTLGTVCGDRAAFAAIDVREKMITMYDDTVKMLLLEVKAKADKLRRSKMQ